MSTPCIPPLIRVGALTLAALALLSPLSIAVAAEDKPYTVVCDQEPDYDRMINGCRVDDDTYVGWRTYNGNCLRCHGQSGEGSTFAPSLLDRLQEIDKERFVVAVADGYTGQVGVMPPWKDNPNVNKYYDQLYSFLKARSDGVLAPGRPRKMK